ncbi:MAG: hypothetical protein K6E94_07170, partial [Elusimicrobiaceae bacterium]|nr:hypothetical protein [Elusimicrobiaceae bacterium]
MDNLNIPVSREGLQDLIKKRRLFSFLFLLSVALAAGIFYVAEKHYHYENIGILIMTLLVTPFIFFAFLSKYNDALINTTYHLIARNLHWKAHKLGKKYKALYDLYQHSLQNFGLLQQDGYLEFHSELEGEIENYKFTLQDISLIEMRRGKNG